MSKRCDFKQNIADNFFFLRVGGPIALFTDPLSYSNGKTSLPYPTHEALRCIVRSVYSKPTFQIHIDAVQIINAPLYSALNQKMLRNPYRTKSAQRFSINYLINVEYIIKFHMEWNKCTDLFIKDQNTGKHVSMMTRRLANDTEFRNVYFGIKECMLSVKEVATGFDQNAPTVDYNKTHNTPMYYGKIYPDGANDGDFLKTLYFYPSVVGGILEYPHESTFPANAAESNDSGFFLLDTNKHEKFKYKEHTNATALDALEEAMLGD